jgi:DNA repair photolyase
MQITEREAKSILTEQTVGFLSDGEFPFTHALSPYTGCMFGNTTCGLYCYAAHLPSWT